MLLLRDFLFWDQPLIHNSLRTNKFLFFLLKTHICPDYKNNIVPRILNNLIICLAEEYFYYPDKCTATGQSMNAIIYDKGYVLFFLLSCEPDDCISGHVHVLKRFCMRIYLGNSSVIMVISLCLSH